MKTKRFFLWALISFALGPTIQKAGAAARSVGAKSGAELLAQDFGALGDDSNDDTAELQAGIDAAALAVATTRTFRIPRGAYRISGPLSIPNFVNVVGDGESTIIRPTGNFYAFNFHPGDRSSVSALQIFPTVVQSSGGAFDYTKAGSNIHLDLIYFNTGVRTSLNISPASPAGIYTFRRLRWMGGKNCHTAILIDGAALVTDCYFHQCIGTAATQSDMVFWLNAVRNADTIRLTDCLFYRGTTGLSYGTTSQVTNMYLTGVVVDQMRATGINVNKARVLVSLGTTISTCGAGNVEALSIGPGSIGAQFTGGVIQNCGGYGVMIKAGALHTLLHGVTVTDNNTTNTAVNDGIAVAANATDFEIIGCKSGNNAVLASGFQRTGIKVKTGASDRYSIVGNTCLGNVTTDFVDDQGTGVNKIIANNRPTAFAVVASAATITLPSYTDVISVSGTTNITSVTASWIGRKVKLVFQGALTFTAGSNLKLAGNFVTTADDSIIITCVGANWNEDSRSANA